MSSEEHTAIIESREESTIPKGIWYFLFSELVIFGGMILVYAVYKLSNRFEFNLASKELSSFIGALNAVILITGSLTLTLSITAIKKGKKLLSVYLQSVTFLLAAGFLANKFYETTFYINNGIYFGGGSLPAKSAGENLFFNLFYIITGLHTLHVVLAIIILLMLIRKVNKGIINNTKYGMLENAGLFWHVITIVWLFLFPLLYLIG